MNALEERAVLIPVLAAMLPPLTPSVVHKMKLAAIATRKQNATLEIYDSMSGIVLRSMPYRSMPAAVRQCLVERSFRKSWWISIR